MKYKFEQDIMVARFVETAKNRQVGIFGVGMEWPGTEEFRLEFRNLVTQYADNLDYVYLGLGYLVPKDTEVEIEDFNDELELMLKPGTPVFEFPQSVIDHNKV